MGKLKILSTEKIYQDHEIEIMNCLWDWGFISNGKLEKINPDMKTIFRSQLFKIFLKYTGDPISELSISPVNGHYSISVSGGDYVMFHYNSPFSGKRLFELETDQSVDTIRKMYTTTIKNINVLLNKRIIMNSTMCPLENVIPSPRDTDVIQSVINHGFNDKPLASYRKQELLRRYKILLTSSEKDLYVFNQLKFPSHCLSL